tara:strand:- start:817 stop:1932 length:1116 start_codon:yes stop_codon:yes gene_type:complete
MKKQEIIHIIISLTPGGTEYKLLNLIKDTESIFNHSVIVLTFAEKNIKDELLINRVKLKELHISGLFSLTKSLFQLRSNFLTWRVDLLVGWLYHGNLFTILFKKILGSKSELIWNIRSSLSSLKTAPLHRKLVIFISKFFLNSVNAVIYNSELSLIEHKAYGYGHINELVIKNGIDTYKFRKVQGAKEVLCDELGIDKNKPLIGMCARFHPIKNHPLLIHSVINLIDRGYDLNCILCGDGLNEDNREIVNLINKRSNSFFLLGHRDDLPSIYSALDIHILTSFSESSSNSILESISCGTKVISTEVGISKDILESKFLLNTYNIEELSNKIILLLEEKPDVEVLTKRIRNDFSIKKMNAEFTNLYKGIIHK